jgi:membrane protease YdiL (CAAX protease family)
MTSSEFLPPRPELPDGMTWPESTPPPGPPEPREAPKAAGVPLWVPFAVMAAVFVVVGSFYAAVVGIAHSLDPSFKTSNPPEGLTIGITMVQDAVLVLAAVLALKLVFGYVRPSELGLRRVLDWRRTLLTAAVLYVLFWVAALILQLIFGTPPEQELVTELKAQESFSVLAGFAVLTCVVAPICEEIFFRGFMFMAFARRLGPRWGAVIAGGIFGLIHAPNPVLGLIALGVLGVCLCALYWRTQSIIPCMALHALNNSISFGLTKSLDAGVFLALVIGSVALVVAIGTAVAERPAVTA